MTNLTTTAQSFLGALKGKQEPQPYDTQATVTRVDGDTLYVHIPGGVDETPVQRTIDASVGDTIQIRVSGGSAWATGNASAPPTDDSRAEQVMARVDGITLRVIGSNGQVSEIRLDDQGRINLLGTLLAQTIMAEDIMATGSFQVDNGVWKLIQDTNGFHLETTARSTELDWAPMAELTLNATGGGFVFDGALAGMQYWKTGSGDDEVRRLSIMLNNSDGVLMTENGEGTWIAVTADQVFLRNVLAENDILPETNGYPSLGAPSYRWANVHTNKITLAGDDLATLLSSLESRVAHIENSLVYPKSAT